MEAEEEGARFEMAKRPAGHKREKTAISKTRKLVERPKIAHDFSMYNSGRPDGSSVSQQRTPLHQELTLTYA